MRKRVSSKARVRLYVLALIIAMMALSTTAPLWAQSTERFGIGTFTYHGRTFTGLVLRIPNEIYGKPGFVVDLAPAAAAAKQTAVPKGVLAIIDQWNSGAEAKIKATVKFVSGQLDGKTRPSYVYDYTAVKAERPFLPPMGLYAFSNYPGVIAGEDKKDVKLPPTMPGFWDRPPSNPNYVKDGKDTRPQNPFAFIVPSSPSVFAGDRDPIVIYKDRPQVEYECELMGVLGKPARRVSWDKMKDYMFGYANANDVSDRGSRTPDPIAGDWTSQKVHDGYKPFGPFIVPKEFVDPLDEPFQMIIVDAAGVEHKLQEGSTKAAYHSVYDFFSWASNLFTVPTGAVFSYGTPPGSHGGLGRSMLAGDVNRCSYKGLGTLTNVVQNEK